VRVQQTLARAGERASQGDTSTGPNSSWPLASRVARTRTRRPTALRLVKFHAFHKNGRSTGLHNSEPLLYPKPDQSTLCPSIAIHSNILLPFASRSSKLSPYFRIPYQNPVGICLLPASPIPFFLICLPEQYQACSTMLQFLTTKHCV